MSVAGLGNTTAKLNVYITRAKGLPVMDKGSQSSDSYVEVKFGEGAPQKTKICAKSLNPVWKSEFKFDLGKHKMFQNPLEIKVMDQNVVHDDMIGMVYIDVNCLLFKGGVKKISGWYPIYDTLRGLRGQIYLVISLSTPPLDISPPLFSPSQLVQFFSISMPIDGYQISKVIGFVEELIVEDDPEFHWKDTFRYSRITNEQRQRLLYHTSGKLRRKIGMSVIDMGGNAVLGYQQFFDLEGEGGGGIVARAYGTCCLLSPISTECIKKKEEVEEGEEGVIANNNNNNSAEQVFRFDKNFTDVSVKLITLTYIPANISYQFCSIVSVRSIKIMKNNHRRRNRDKWWTSLRRTIQENAFSLSCNVVFGYTETTTIHDEVVVLSATGTACRVLTDINRDQLFTPSVYSVNNNNLSGSNNTIGVTSALNTPLIDDNSNNNINDNNNNNNNDNVNNKKLKLKKKKKKKRADEEEELASSYEEEEGKRVVKVSGEKNNLKSSTASHISLSKKEMNIIIKESKLDKNEKINDSKNKKKKNKNNISIEIKENNIENKNENNIEKENNNNKGCGMFHVPYYYSYSSSDSSQPNKPFPKLNLSQCKLCKSAFVPELLLSTTEPPSSLSSSENFRCKANAVLQARVCRHIKKPESKEQFAILISENLTFLEFDLHSQLKSKMKMMGANVCFGIKYQITIGSNFIAATAIGTAGKVKDLPSPPQVVEIFRTSSRDVGPSTPRGGNNNNNINNDHDHDDDDDDLNHPHHQHHHDDDDDETSSSSIDRQSESRYVMEVTDKIDEENIATLGNQIFPFDIFVSNIERPPQLRIEKEEVKMEFLTFLLKLKWIITKETINNDLSSIFHSLLSYISFHMVERMPCVLAGVTIDFKMTNENEVQLLVNCMATNPPPDHPLHRHLLLSNQLSSNELLNDNNNNNNNDEDDQEMIFNLIIDSPPTSPSRSDKRFAKGDLVCYTKDLDHLYYFQSMGNTSCRLYARKDEIGTFDLAVYSPSLKYIRYPSKEEIDLFIVNNNNNNNGSMEEMIIETAINQSGGSISNNSTNSLSSYLPPSSSIYQSPVEISSLSYLPIPSLKSVKYIGRVNLHFIRENRENNNTNQNNKTSTGTTGYIETMGNSFITEALSIARSHVAAIGGNFIVGFKIDTFFLTSQDSNNQKVPQCYSFLSISGDALLVSL